MEGIFSVLRSRRNTATLDLPRFLISTIGFGRVGRDEDQFVEDRPTGPNPGIDPQFGKVRIKLLIWLLQHVPQAMYFLSSHLQQAFNSFVVVRTRDERCSQNGRIKIIARSIAEIR
jgi:hypothetical protein